MTHNLTQPDTHHHRKACSVSLQKQQQSSVTLSAPTQINKYPNLPLSLTDVPFYELHVAIVHCLRSALHPPPVEITFTHAHTHHSISKTTLIRQ